MQVPEFLCLFSGEGAFTVQACLPGQRHVAQRRASPHELAALLHDSPAAMTFDDWHFPIARYELDPVGKVLRIYAQGARRRPSQAASAAQAPHFPALPAQAPEAPSDDPAALPSGAQALAALHAQYLALLHWEVQALGVQPTALVHLLGRLGEFHCALQVGGQLAARTHQRGFDVLGPDGQRISVKTTAQASGFVAIGQSTAAQADALMLVQYRDGETHTLYYGPMQPALDSARVYGSSFELDLSVARRLAAG